MALLFAETARGLLVSVSLSFGQPRCVIAHVRDQDDVREQIHGHTKGILETDNFGVAATDAGSLGSVCV